MRVGIITLIGAVAAIAVLAWFGLNQVERYECKKVNGIETFRTIEDNGTITIAPYIHSESYTCQRDEYLKTKNVVEDARFQWCQVNSTNSLSEDACQDLGL